LATTGVGKSRESEIMQMWIKPNGSAIEFGLAVYQMQN